MPKGEWTNAALLERYAAREYDDILLASARDYALGHSLGARQAISTGLFPGVRRNLLHNTMNGKGRLAKKEQGVRALWDVLTDNEERALANWIIESGRGKDPPTDADVSDQVVIMLKARRLDNRHRKHSPGTIPLTTAEQRLVTEADAEVSHIWLSKFAGRHPEVAKQKERNADASRTKKQNEGVVKKHFDGEFGVVESLKSIGNLDDEGKIIDPRRCVWFDEMPQVMDAANQGPRSKAWGAAGEPLERAGSVNRETGSVGMAFSLDGFLYGPQFNVGRENWTCALADCLDAPDWAKSFDDQIYTLDGKSTYCCMSKTANGVQTASSFEELLNSIKEQTSARSRAEVAAGRPPIEFPIWLGTDNHGSRFSPEVLEKCGPYAKDLGIRLFMEEAKTSQFLQPPDQVTKLCHGAYIRGRKHYQKLHHKKYGEPAAIGIIEFIEIWGGCRELGYEGAWFGWATSQVFLDAWRRCGWLGCIIAPEEIDRVAVGFVDQAPSVPDAEPKSPPLTLEQANAVPDGMRAGTLVATQALVAQLQKYIGKNLHASFDPVEAGLMVARTAESRKRVRDKTRIEESEGGDAHLRGLAISARAKQLRKSQEAAAVAERKVARLEKKTALEAGCGDAARGLPAVQPHVQLWSRDVPVGGSDPLRRLRRHQERRLQEGRLRRCQGAADAHDGCRCACARSPSSCAVSDGPVSSRARSGARFWRCLQSEAPLFERLFLAGL